LALPVVLLIQSPFHVIICTSLESQLVGTDPQGTASNQVSRHNAESAGEVAIKNHDELLNQVSARLRTWKFAFGVWGAVHYITGIVGIAASAMAAASLWHPATSIVASVCFGALGFANPQKKHYAFSNAWRMVDIARIRYEQGLGTVEDMLHAMELGERLISEGEQAGQSPVQVEIPTPENRVQNQP
jgi:hypothetical protein